VELYWEECVELIFVFEEGAIARIIFSSHVKGKDKSTEDEKVPCVEPKVRSMVLGKLTPKGP